MEEFKIKEGCKRVIVDFDARTIVQEFGEKFEPKNGDFCVAESGSVFIYKCPNHETLNKLFPHSVYAILTKGGLFYLGAGKGIRLATDSERQQLLDAIAKEGKAWDAENKMIVKKRWMAEFGCYYWVVSADGNILRDTEHEDNIDRNRYNFGNYHKTREDAEAYRDKIYKLRND